MTASGTLGHDGGERPYHHGDLRNALVSAAVGLAAEGGPEAVTLRAAARSVGVTPTAAYRHFAGQAELLASAHHVAEQLMHDTMAEEIAAQEVPADPVEAALAMIRGAGRGYIRFAREQPGLFHTVCLSVDDAPSLAEEDLAETAPYALLAEALDRLVEVGWIDPAQRPLAEAPAWAAVHGMSLLLDGPYRDLPAQVRTAFVERTFDMVLRGLATGPAADLALLDQGLLAL